MPTPAPYDPARARVASRRNLPHLRMEGAIYYLTFRLHDSLPASKLKDWHRQSQSLSQEQRKTELARRMERWLDLGQGACLLELPGVAEIIRDSLNFFDAQRYWLDEWVVMPNHIHVLVMPETGFELSDISHSWKSYTAHEINKHLGRTGALWQHEPFDHLVRDRAALERFRCYIRGNPRKLPNRRSLQGTGQFTGHPEHW